MVSASWKRQRALGFAFWLALIEDGTQPFAERVRVAKRLRVHAPDEVDRLAEETAHAELARTR